MRNFQDPTSKDDWIEVTLNKNKNSKVYNRNLIQLISHAANKFELLTNLKEERETSIISNKKEETSSIGNHQKKTRKTQLVKSSKRKDIKYQ
jgi:hypothetical protein